MPGPSSIDAICPADRRGSSGSSAGTPGGMSARHFHAVRDRPATAPCRSCPGRPVVVVLNHPSWWDPLIAVHPDRSCPTGGRTTAPIESVGLAQYPFLARLGFFGFDTGTAAGAVRFLRTSLAILARPESVLWITAQGEFVDARVAPDACSGPGSATWRSRLTDATDRPDGPRISVLERPVPGGPGPVRPAHRGRDRRPHRSPRDWTADDRGEPSRRRSTALAHEAMAPRSRRPFETLLGGTAGVGGVYDIWRRIRARLGGTCVPTPSTRRVPGRSAGRPVDRSNHVPDAAGIRPR